MTPDINPQRCVATDYGRPRCIGLREQRPCVGQEAGTIGSEANSARPAYQQLGAQALFKTLDSPRDGLLAQIEPLRGVTEVMMIGDHHECAHLRQIEIHCSPCTRYAAATNVGCGWRRKKCWTAAASAPLSRGMRVALPADFSGPQVTAVLEHYLRWLDNPADPLVTRTIRRLDFDYSQFDSLRVGRFVVGARSRLMDRWTGQFLAANPSAIALDLGAGIDRRMARVGLGPGHHWYDVDFPGVAHVAGQLYEESPQHSVIATDVTELDWLAEIPAGRPAAVIADGLFNLLAEADVRRLLCRIAEHFPRGEIYFNITGSVVRRQRDRRPVPLFAEYGIAEKWFVDDPIEVESFDARLHLVEQQGQIAAPFVRSNPLYYRMLCAVLRSVPGLGASGSVLRFRFGEDRQTDE